MRTPEAWILYFTAVCAVPLLLAGCGDLLGPETLRVYSSFPKRLIEPILEEATAEGGPEIRVRYGPSDRLSERLLQEGDQPGADVFLSRYASSLGRLQVQGRLKKLPGDLLDSVPERFRSPDGSWVGLTGRVRLMVYNPNRVESGDLPRSVWELIEPRWSKRVGWAPGTVTFRDFVTAMRRLEGTRQTRAWLEAMRENGVRGYETNEDLVSAVSRGEIDLGLADHDGVIRVRQTDPETPVRVHRTNRDAACLINVSGAGLLKGSSIQSEARDLIRRLLSPPAQKRLARRTYEYPLLKAVPAPSEMTPLRTLPVPELNLNELAGVEETRDLLREVGLRKVEG